MNRILMIGWAVLCTAFAAHGALTLSVHTNVISGDYAADGPLPAFKPIADIVITETLPDDIAVQSNRLLVFDAPGWRFLPSSGALTIASDGDLTNASLEITPRELRVRFTSVGTNRLDSITVSGLQVRADSYASGTGRIRRPQGSDDNAVLRSIGINSTEVAWMFQTPPAWRSMAPLRVVGFTNAHAILRFGVEPNVLYTIESSEDLRAWTAIGNATAETNEIVLFPDTTSTGASHRFYRLMY